MADDNGTSQGVHHHYHFYGYGPAAAPQPGAPAEAAPAYDAPQNAPQASAPGGNPQGPAQGAGAPGYPPPGFPPAGFPFASGAPGAQAGAQPGQAQAGAGFNWHQHPAADSLIKGLVVGAGAAYLLTNETAQRTILRTAVQVWAFLQGGVEELKERLHDAEAEVAAAAAPGATVPTDLAEAELAATPSTES